jgi:uncharacterized protein (DUF169 family)
MVDMTHEALARELKLSAPFVSMNRIQEESGDSPVIAGCAMRVLQDVFQGRRVVLTMDAISCRGGRIGFGFLDGLADIPGGMGYFLSIGRGEGFRAGERLKCCPEVAEASILNQPRAVMKGFDALEIKPYEAGEPPDLALALVNADQLSALTILYSYRTADFDRVIMPMSSGCASIARIPLGELRGNAPRAVIGNSDVMSRQYFDRETFFFTMPGRCFDEMLRDADTSFLFAPMFAGVKKRLR